MNQCARCATITDGGQFYRFYFGVVVDEPATSRPSGQETTEPDPTSRSPAGKSQPDLLDLVEAKNEQEAGCDGGPFFQVHGTEEVYFCDRCLLRAAARGDLIRSAFYLVLRLLAVAVVVILVEAQAPGVWCPLVVLLLVALLGTTAFQSYRRMRAALSGSREQMRDTVHSSPKLQNLGDSWAISHRRQALQESGAELFMSREDYEFWKQEY